MGLVNHNDRAFAFGVCRFFNRRFKTGVRDLLSSDFSGAEGRDRQVERESENEFCHTHRLFREPGMTVITVARTQFAPRRMAPQAQTVVRATADVLSIS